MSTARTATAPLSPARHRRRRRGAALPVRVRVLLARGTLDRVLVEGADPDSTPELALRALQLTRPASRRGLAASLDGVIASAHRGTRRYASSPPLACRAIRSARPALEELATALREEPAVSARGVALTRRLLADGAGPLYVSTPRGTLLRAAQETAAALTAAA